MLSTRCARTAAALGGFPWFMDHCSINPFHTTERCHTRFQELSQTEAGDDSVQADRAALRAAIWSESFANLSDTAQTVRCTACQSRRTRPYTLQPARHDALTRSLLTMSSADQVRNAPYHTDGCRPRCCAYGARNALGEVGAAVEGASAEEEELEESTARQRGAGVCRRGRLCHSTPSRPAHCTFLFVNRRNSSPSGPCWKMKKTQISNRGCARQTAKSKPSGQDR